MSELQQPQITKKLFINTRKLTKVILCVKIGHVFLNPTGFERQADRMRYDIPALYDGEVQFWVEDVTRPTPPATPPSPPATLQDNYQMIYEEIISIQDMEDGYTIGLKDIVKRQNYKEAMLALEQKHTAEQNKLDEDLNRLGKFGSTGEVDRKALVERQREEHLQLKKTYD